MAAPPLKQTFLDFEQPIAELQAKIDELRYVHEDSAVDISDEITRLQKKSNQLTKDIYGKLTAWQIAMVARHPQRPYALDYINSLFSDFRELHGDRSYADDPAIVGGLARFNGKPCMVLGHQKGRDTKEKIYRNFGMPRPGGLSQGAPPHEAAEKFGLPLFTFVDTPGAYPGIGAEERGQSEAIGRNLYEMAGLRIPIVVTVIGEGGSGGALAVAIGDVTLMLQYATYSVISPEGCASILWKSAEQAPEAAETLGITAPRLKQLGLIDKVVNEPLGGAHRDPAAMMIALKKALTEALRALTDQPLDALLEAREDKILSLRQVQGDSRGLTPEPLRSLACCTRAARSVRGQWTGPRCRTPPFPSQPCLDAVPWGLRGRGHRPAARRQDARRRRVVGRPRFDGTARCAPRACGRPAHCAFRRARPSRPVRARRCVGRVLRRSVRRPQRAARVHRVRIVRPAARAWRRPRERRATRRLRQAMPT
jgi:acetyl-CoA carboxylase carboxyl transferase subunit alpha